MQRKPTASPGGVQPSDTKKRRLEKLQASHAGFSQTLNTGGSLFKKNKQAAGSFTLPPVAPGRQGQQGSTRPAVKGSTATVAPDAQMGTPTNADARIGEVPYTKLNPAVLQGQLAHVVKDMPKSSGALEWLTDELLSTNPAFAARSSEVRATAGLRVQDKSLLLDNPPATRSGSVTRQSPSYSKGLQRKSKGESRSLFKQLKGVKLDQLQPMKQLWTEYMQGLLESGASSSSLVKLMATADLHGCSASVLKHRNARLVGREGMVVHASQATVWIMDEENKLHIIPKQGCQMACTLPDGRRLLVAS